MNLHKYRAFFLIIITVLALFLATPVLTDLFTVPQTSYYTEFYILGPYHNTTYPSAAFKTNTAFYLNIENHLGYTGNYLIEVKFRNVNGSSPDSFKKTSSSLPSLYNIKVVVDDSEKVETKLILAFGYSGSSVSTLTINGVTVACSTSLVKESTGTYGNLFFELWLYNETTKAYQYNERYVSLWFDFS